MTRGLSGGLVMLVAIRESFLHEDAEVGKGLVGGIFVFPSADVWVEFFGGFEGG